MGLKGAHKKLAYIPDRYYTPALVKATAAVCEAAIDIHEIAAGSRMFLC